MRKVILWLLAIIVLAGGIFGVKKFWLDENVKPSSDAPIEETPSAPLPPIELNQAQQKVVREFFAVADEITAALSGDNLEKFNVVQPNVSPAVKSLAEAFAEDHPWTPVIHEIQAAPLTAAGDLTEARTKFLPFSKAVSDLAKMARGQNAAFRDLKVYRCPMAEKPGIWMQLQGPLKNPYFGDEMLDCGTEVKP